MAKVNIDYLSQEVVKQLSQWVDDLDEKIMEIAQDEGKHMLDNVKKDSPVKTGEYKKGWRRKTVRSSKYIKIVAYNKLKPELTWLLENGHALPEGGRSKAFPHLKKNEKKANEDFIRRVEELI